MPGTACFLLKHSKNNALVTKWQCGERGKRNCRCHLMWSPAAGPCQEKCSLRCMHSCYYLWCIQNKNDNHIACYDVRHGQHGSWGYNYYSTQRHSMAVAAWQASAAVNLWQSDIMLRVLYRKWCMIRSDYWTYCTSDFSAKQLFADKENTYSMGYVPPTRTQLIF